MRLLRGSLALFVLLVVVDAGERDVAQFLLRKAEKAYRAKDYEKAATGFKRARAEFTPLPEAAWGLGQALEKLGRESAAIAAYRLCTDEVGASTKPSAKWKSLARKAKAATAKLRRRFAELDRVNRDFIQNCMKFGKEHLKSDPRWARTAFETILKIDPTHKDARRYLGKFTKAKAPVEKKPEAAKHFGIALIRGDELETSFGVGTRCVRGHRRQRRALARFLERCSPADPVLHTSTRLAVGVVQDAPDFGSRWCLRWRLRILGYGDARGLGLRGWWRRGRRVGLYGQRARGRYLW